MLLPLRGSPYGVGDQLSSVEMNILNDEIAHALDAINGGTYALTAPIVVTGASSISLANVVITTALQLNNSTAVNIGSSVTINGSPTWAGTITWSGGGIAIGTISIAGGVESVASGGVVSFASGSTLTVATGATATFNNNPTFSAGHIVTFAGDVHLDGSATVSSGHLFTVAVGGTLQVLGLEVVSGTLGVSGTLSVDSGGTLQVGATGSFGTTPGALIAFGSVVSFTGNVNFGSTAPISLASVLTPTGSGHVRVRLVSDNTTLNATITIGIATGGGIVAGDAFVLSDPITADRDWTLTSTGASVGDVVHCSLISSSGFRVRVLRDDTSVVASLIHGSNASVTAMFDGTNWLQVHLSPG